VRPLPEEWRPAVVLGADDERTRDALTWSRGSLSAWSRWAPAGAGGDWWRASSCSGWAASLVLSSDRAQVEALLASGAPARLVLGADPGAVSRTCRDLPAAVLTGRGRTARELLSRCVSTAWPRTLLAVGAPAATLRDLPLAGVLTEEWQAPWRGGEPRASLGGAALPGAPRGVGLLAEVRHLAEEELRAAGRWARDLEDPPRVWLAGAGAAELRELARVLRSARAS
jgi:hypothetical protein